MYPQIFISYHPHRYVTVHGNINVWDRINIPYRNPCIKSVKAPTPLLQPVNEYIYIKHSCEAWYVVYQLHHKISYITHQWQSGFTAARPNRTRHVVCQVATHVSAGSSPTTNYLPIPFVIYDMLYKYGPYYKVFYSLSWLCYCLLHYVFGDICRGIHYTLWNGTS